MEYLIALLAVIILALIFVILRKRDRDALGESLPRLTQKMEDMQKALDAHMHRSAESVQNQMRRQFEDSRKLITEITKELTEVKATGREMLSFTEQLQSLERSLKNPQRRGAVGEYMLEQVIANVLPPGSYATQYSFSNSTRADAVVFLQDGKMICIDAKFSLDNYTKLFEGEVENPKAVERQLREDLKKRVQETAKYIIPKEGTLDYAFMFIPSEALYYDLLTQKIGGSSQDMLAYAFNEHKVIIVSPTTLLAYLQTVQFGLRSFKIEAKAQEIMKHMTALKKHLDSHSKAFHGVGRAIGTAVNHYNKAEKQYRMIDKDVFRITGEGGDYINEVLDPPRSQEED